MVTSDSVRISVTLPREQAEQLTRWAEEVGCSEAEIVRRALSLYEPGAEFIPEFLGALSEEVLRVAARPSSLEDMDERLAADKAADAELHARIRMWMKENPGKAPSLDLIRELDPRP